MAIFCIYGKVVLTVQHLRPFLEQQVYLINRNLSSAIYYRQMVICGTDTEYTTAAHVIIGNSLTDLNYIRERIIIKPGVQDTLTASQLLSPTDAQQTTQYFDGLGRPIQKVSKQITPLGKDLLHSKYMIHLAESHINTYPLFLHQVLEIIKPIHLVNN